MVGQGRGNPAEPGDDIATKRQARRHVGQFFTPDPIADFMVDELDLDPSTRIRLLDAGAGAGALTSAFLRRHRADVAPGSEITAVERDEHLVSVLSTLTDPDDRIKVDVQHRDFLVPESKEQAPKYTHALLNPPYRRLFAHHEHWAGLRDAGISVPNLYAAFLWYAIEQLEPGGQLVAIVPRSFCNGSRYAAFRRYLREHASIDRVHVFDSRVAVFSVDSVLQETIIIGLRKSRQVSGIRMSWTSGHETRDARTIEVPAARVLDEGDISGPIRIPASPETAEQGGLEAPGRKLNAYNVSVGSVVDFRWTDHLRDAPEVGSVPLVDSRWHRISRRDRTGSRLFARWMVVDALSTRHVRPVGDYVVIKRVSPKEQRPRLRVAVLSAGDLTGYDGVAFENHVCVIHDEGAGLEPAEARAVAEELSTLRADEYLRELSGSTQINVTDIRAVLWGSSLKWKGTGTDARFIQREHGSAPHAADNYLDLGTSALRPTRS